MKRSPDNLHTGPPKLRTFGIRPRPEASTTAATNDLVIEAEKRNRDAIERTKRLAGTFYHVERAKKLKEQGNIKFQEKDWDAAIGLYTQAIETDRSNAALFTNRAAAFMQKHWSRGHARKAHALMAMQSFEDCAASAQQAIACVQQYLARSGTAELAPPFGESKASLKSYSKLLRKARKGAR